MSVALSQLGGTTGLHTIPGVIVGVILTRTHGKTTNFSFFFVSSEASLRSRQVAESKFSPN